MENSALDGSGNGYTATLQGGAAYDNAQFGRGVKLQSSDIDYVNIGDVPMTDGLSAATWSIRFMEPSIAWFGVLYSCWGATNSSHIIVRKGNTANTEFFVFVANASNDGGTNYGITNPGGYAAGSWNNLMVVFDGTQTGNANRLKVYLNGANLGFASFSGTIPATLTSPTTKYWALGRWFIGAPSYGFLGSLDEFGVWSRALTQPDIRRVMLGLHPIS